MAVIHDSADWRIRRLKLHFDRLHDEFSSTASVHRAALRLSLVSRRRIASLCEFALSHRKWIRDRDLRVRAAKTLVALLPGSIERITRIIHWSSDRYSYEAHFTLFVFLADVEDLGLPDEITSNVRDLLGAYLVNVSVPTAGAAWMAGHALGDHFENPEAAESLHHLALDARFAVGRSSAVTGLSEWLQEHSTHDSRRYRRTLASIAKRDKSARVRASARVGLERIQAKAHK